jgi:signal transduction histidine kinase
MEPVPPRPQPDVPVIVKPHATSGFDWPRFRGRRGLAFELALGLALLVTTLSLVAAGAVARLVMATERYEAATRDSLEHLLLAERLRSGVEQSVAAKRGFLIGNNPRFLDRMRQADEALEQTLALLATQTHDREDVQAVAAIERAHAAYRSVVDGADGVIQKKLHGAAPREVAALFERDLIGPRQHLDEVVDDLVDAKERRLAEANLEVGRGRSRALATAVGTLGLGVFAGVALAVALGRHFSKVYHREQEALQRAERATATREEMVTIVAHDLRNPVNAIGLRASSMRGSGDDKIRQHGEAIARVVGGMERLLRSLLDAASIEAGRFTLRPSSWSTEDLLHDLVEVFGPLASSSGLELDCQPAAAPFVLRGDRERVFQVLSNLVGNAMKFAPQRSRITVAVARQNDEVTFCVADAGPGIAAEHLPHIFDRFWKGDGEGRSGSTGLGLYIARKVVETHGGRIWAESTVGAGSVFRFTLPLAVPSARPGVEAAAAAGATVGLDVRQAAT